MTNDEQWEIVFSTVLALRNRLTTANPRYVVRAWKGPGIHGWIALMVVAESGRVIDFTMTTTVLSCPYPLLKGISMMYLRLRGRNGSQPGDWALYDRVIGHLARDLVEVDLDA